MTQVDSIRPVLFNVTIDGSSFVGNLAPRDGFIDPVSTQKYEQRVVQTGTVLSPTVTIGDTIAINGVGVTINGTDLSAVVAAINTLTDIHHVIAEDVGSKLVITNAPTYENFGLTLTGSDGVLAALGFMAPVATMPYSAGGSTLANNEAKMRANSRWESLTKLLNFEANTLSVGVISDDGTPDVAPSAIVFNVAYQNISLVYTFDETNNNALIKGIPALKRIIARALVLSRTENRVIIDPAIDPTYHFVIGDKVESLVIDKIADDLAAAEAAIAVDFITQTR